MGRISLRRLRRGAPRTLDSPDVEIVLGVAERQHHRRPLAQVAHLLGVRLGEDKQDFAIPPEPDRDEVRSAVGSDGGQPDRPAPGRGTGGSVRRRATWCPCVQDARGCRLEPRTSVGAAMDRRRSRDATVVRLRPPCPARAPCPVRLRAGWRFAGRFGELPVPRPEALEQPAAGQVEVDRRDGDPPVDHGVEVGALDGQPGRRRPADPEVRDPARIDALDQLVLVDALAEPGDLDASNSSSATAGTLTLISSPGDSPCSRMLRATVVAARAASAKSGCS